MTPFKKELERRRIAQLLNPYSHITWNLPPSPDSRRAGLEWLREGCADPEPSDPRPDPRTHPDYWTE